MNIEDGEATDKNMAMEIIKQLKKRQREENEETQIKDDFNYMECFPEMGPSLEQMKTYRTQAGVASSADAYKEKFDKKKSKPKKKDYDKQLNKIEKVIERNDKIDYNLH
jgi:hypothetical protein